MKLLASLLKTAAGFSWQTWLILFLLAAGTGQQTVIKWKSRKIAALETDKVELRSAVKACEAGAAAVAALANDQADDVAIAEKQADAIIKRSTRRAVVILSAPPTTDASAAIEHLRVGLTEVKPW